MAFKMKSSIAKLTNSPAKQTNTLPTVNISGTSRKNKKLKAEYDAKMKAYQDSTASYENRVKINELLNPDGRMTDSEFEIAKSEIKKLQDENVKRGIYDDPTEGVGVGEHYMGGPDPRNTFFMGDTSMDDSLKPTTKPKEPRYDQEVVRLDMKALKNIPSPSIEPDLKKSLPIGIYNDRYYTTEKVGQNTQTMPKGNDGLPLIKLKDQTGNVVFEGSQTEYNEKYRDALQRGTKQYGQENLKRRLYPRGYTKI
jgi:hypothetical protein